MSFLTLAAKAAGGGGAAAVLCGGKSPYNNNCLPILRWGNYLGTLNYRGGQTVGNSWFSVNVDPLRRIPSQVASAMLNAGNGLYQAAAGFLQKAENWSWNANGQASDTTTGLGKTANDVAAGIYTGITAGGGILIGLILCVSLIMLLGRAIRLSGSGGAGVAKRIVALTLGVGLFLTMGAQAAKAPSGNNPPALSPWWVANTTGEFVNKMGGNMLNGLVKGTRSQLATYSYPGLSSLSCRGYMQALNDLAKDKNGNDRVDPNILSLNMQWENTAVPMWDREFFGDPANADYTFCRVLETKAGVPATAQIAITKKAAGNGNADASPFKPTSDTSKSVMFQEPSVVSQDSVSKAKEGQDDDHVGVAEDDGTKLDQYLVAWETCGLNRKAGKGRTPVKSDVRPRNGWQFVNHVQGSSRGAGNTKAHHDGDYPGDADKDAKKDLPTQCYAALYGEMPDGTNADVDTTFDPKTGATYGKDDTGVEGNGNFARIVQKFDLPASGDVGGANWQTIALGTDTNTGTQSQKRAAVATVNAQHGADGMSNINAAFMFMLAGLVNFAIYGVALTLSKLLSLAASMLMAVFLWVLLLAWAVSPDTYGRKMGSMMLKLVGMTGANILLSLFFSLTSIISNALLDATGMLSSNDLTLLAVCGGVFPVVSAMLIARMLEAVGLGHLTPKSLARLMGGAALMGGVATIGRGVAQRVQRGSIGMGRGRHAMPDGSTEAHGAAVGKGGTAVTAHRSAAASAAAASVKARNAKLNAKGMEIGLGRKALEAGAFGAAGKAAALAAGKMGKTRLGQHMASAQAKMGLARGIGHGWLSKADKAVDRVHGTGYRDLRSNMQQRFADPKEHRFLARHRVVAASAATLAAGARKLGAKAALDARHAAMASKDLARRGGQWAKRNAPRAGRAALGAAAVTAAGTVGGLPAMAVAAGVARMHHKAVARGAALERGRIASQEAARQEDLRTRRDRALPSVADPTDEGWAARERARGARIARESQTAPAGQDMPDLAGPDGRMNPSDGGTVDMPEALHPSASPEPPVGHAARTPRPMPNPGAGQGM